MTKTTEIKSSLLNLQKKKNNIASEKRQKKSK